MDGHGLHAVLVHDQAVFEVLVVGQHYVEVDRNVGDRHGDGRLV